MSRLRDMQSARTVNIESHAAATLQYIRSTMDAAATVAVPGSAGIAMGAVGLLAALLSSIPALSARWLAIWLVAAVVAVGSGAVLMLRPASAGGITLSASRLRKFALCLLPSLFAGAALTVVLWKYGAAQAIPGTWLLLYGCALIAVSVHMTETIAVLGGMFVVLGVLAFLLPASLQIALLGAGFGGLHLLFGVLIGRKGHGRET